MIFSPLMVVVMLQMLLLQTSVTEAQVDVSVSPAQIDVGLSSSFDVNCTFSMNTSGMAAVFTLTVSRGNNSELASISSFTDHQVNVISSEGITADGVINPGGQSYIHLHWDYPTDTQKGTYQCVARGIDNLGHNVESVNTSVVTADQPNVYDVMDKRKAVRQRQTSFSQEVQEIQTYITQLENNVSSLNVQVENQLDLSTVFLLPPLSYNNKRYYVSKGPYQDFNESIIICKACGGVLAEMDDFSEFHTVQNYVKNIPDVTDVYLGGTDEGHDGTWVLPSSNTELPVTDWHGSEPSNGETYNCLCLWSGFDWTMSSCRCHYDTAYMSVRYMCEL